MTDMTPAQRLAAGYQGKNQTETERHRIQSIAATHNPEALSELEQADARMAAAGQKLAPTMRAALGYAQNAANAAKITDQHTEK